MPVHNIQFQEQSIKEQIVFTLTRDLRTVHLRAKTEAISLLI